MAEGATSPHEAHRLLMMLFAKGPIGEELKTKVVPWAAAVQWQNDEMDVSKVIDAAWATLDRAWRFIGAVDSRTGENVVTVPNLGLLAVQRLGSKPVIDVRTRMPETDDGIEDAFAAGERKVVIVFAGGAFGESLQTGIAEWDELYETKGHSVDVAEQIVGVARQISAQWWFVGAVDSWTGNVIHSVVPTGDLVVRRMRAHDALCMPDDCADPEDPIATTGD